MHGCFEIFNNTNMNDIYGNYREAENRGTCDKLSTDKVQLSRDFSK